MTESYAQRFEQFLDKRSRIHSLEGEIAYAVIRFPIDRLRKAVPPEIQYLPVNDVYVLRTASSVDEAVNAAISEFKGLGFNERIFNPKYSIGVVKFNDEEVVVRSGRQTTRGMTHWVAEGLVGVYLENVKDKRKVRTEREPTRRLYPHVFAPHGIKVIPLDLIWLTSAEQLYIELSPTYKNSHELFQASGGNPPTRPSIVNFGDRYDVAPHSGYVRVTGFLDPDTDMLYSLNHQTLKVESLGETKGKWEHDNVDGPWGYYEWHKISGIPHFFFDGSLQDIFKLLKEKGFKVPPYKSMTFI